MLHKLSVEWERAAESRAVQFMNSLPQILPPGQDILPGFSFDELQDSQELDPVNGEVPRCSWTRKGFHLEEREQGWVTKPRHFSSHLHEAASLAQQRASEQQRHQATGYNKRVHGTHLEVGDRVLLANKAEIGKRKLADKWEPTIYTVIDRNSQTHIYKVTGENGKTKVVRRNWW